MRIEIAFAKPVRSSRVIALWGVALSGLMWLSTSTAQPAAQSPTDDTADCIAVMQTYADAMARQVKAGDVSREPVLKTELRRAGALIGRTYLDGMRDGDEAKARLKAAQQRQQGWDEERKTTVHGACLKRADAELAAASAPERFFVERFAQSRLKRMLGAH
jgi:hypothetical protein